MIRKLALLFLLLPSAFGQTTYYVDGSRSANGTGTAANPWRNWQEMGFSSIVAASVTNPVTVYLSSRGVWNYPGNDYLPTNAISSSNILFIGEQFYNTNTSGTAVWYPETLYTNRAWFNPQGSGNGFTVENNTYHIWFEGIYQTNAGYACFELGELGGDYDWPGTNGPMSTNIAFITVTNCVLVNPQNLGGIYGPYMQQGCNDIRLSNNYITGTPLEAIYIGHYRYVGNDITNVIVEGNILWNNGMTVQSEGKIGIKQPCVGAIIRSNINYRIGGDTNGSSTGVVCCADNCQIYGNSFSNCQYSIFHGDWGYGIAVECDDMYHVGGQTNPLHGISKCLIRDNLLVNNQNAAIHLWSTIPPGFVNAQIYNNTMIGNAYGITDTPSGTTNSLSITNNIIVGNTNAEMIFTTASHVAPDYNLIGTNGITYNSASQSWISWQAYGFDAHGINTSNANLSASYVPLPISQAINSGINLSSVFNTDIIGNPWPASGPWNIGAFAQQMAWTIINGATMSGVTVH